MRITQDGYAVLSPSGLSRLTGCRLMWRHSLEQPLVPSVGLVVGNTGHSVMKTLGRMNWPHDYFDLAPKLVANALQQEWQVLGVDQPGYDAEKQGLTETIRAFLHSWQPPRTTKPFVETWSDLIDEPTRIWIKGQLDLLIPPTSEGEPAQVFDWKFQKHLPEPPSADDPPLAIVAQAVLARRRLGLRCGVMVRWVYLRSGREDVWDLDQHRLVEGWKRLVSLGNDILADRWQKLRGDYCDRCPVHECEWAPPDMDAAGLGLTEDDC